MTPSTAQRELIPYRWELLIWLWLAFFLNQADRQVFGVVLPLLRADLGLTDVQAGLVASIFTVSLGLVVPIAGYAGDAFSRKWIVTASLMAWSVATLMTGFGTGLLYLIAVRSVSTAVGEAFYAPSANALISEHHVETRAQAMAVHQTSLYTGVVVSGWLAGYLGQRFGWRAAFWVFGSAGMLLAFLLAWRLRDSRAARTVERVSPWPVLRTLLRRPTVLLLALGFTGMVFVNIGYLTWTPTYLHERFGLSLPNAGFSSMFYHHLGAFLGVALGGRISDRVAPRNPAVRPMLQAGALLLGAPFLYLIGSGGTLAVVYLALFCFGTFRGVYDSNIYAALYEVIEPRFHASAASVIIAFAFTGGALAPLALGAAKQAIGLAGGISWLSLVYVVASGFIFAAARFFFHRDYARIHSRG
jgi:MFS family permease